MAERGVPGPDMEGKLDKLISMFGSFGERFKAMENAFENLARDVQGLKKDSDEQKGKIEKIEQEMGAQNKMSKELNRQHEFRLTNLEDRQRRRNLRLRGFKQDFGVGKKLDEAVQAWLNSVGAEISLEDIERAHWSIARRGRDPGRQRDIVIAFASEKKAEKLFKFLRSNAGLKQDANEIIILKDLSRQTLQERAVLRPITTRLFQSGVKFTWAFPAAILVFQGTQMFRARTLEEGKVLLQRLGIEFGEQSGGIGEGAAKGGATSDSSGRGTPDDEERQREEQLKALEAQVEALRKEQWNKPRRERKRRK